MALIDFAKPSTCPIAIVQDQIADLLRLWAALWICLLYVRGCGHSFFGGTLRGLVSTCDIPSIVFRVSGSYNKSVLIRDVC